MPKLLSTIFGACRKWLAEAWEGESGVLVLAWGFMIVGSALWTFLMSGWEIALVLLVALLVGSLLLVGMIVVIRMAFEGIPGSPRISSVLRRTVGPGIFAATAFTLADAAIYQWPHYWGKSILAALLSGALIWLAAMLALDRKLPWHVDNTKDQDA